MSFGEWLLELIIGPLKLIFEVVFALANRRFSVGVSIIGLSLAFNLLALPLFKRADAVQDEARETEEKLSPFVKHIKATFKGDEQYMILQEFYRQNHYSPLNALKGILPLMLEIPFFIAAYQFLSGLTLLEGASFGPIRDLGAPDGLLALGGITINALPILMTVVNLISSEIYTRGAPLKSKIQLYLMAGVFLVLLYQSPAGLTLYWTLNNLFSLGKNIIRKLIERRRLANKVTGRKKNRRVPDFLRRNPNPMLFLLACLWMALLTGLLIPSAVLVSSPSEFIEESAMVNPLWFMLSSFTLGVGMFVIWLGIYYLLAGQTARKFMEWAAWLAAVGMLVNYMLFRTDAGTLSTVLQYERLPSFSVQARLLNLAVLLGIGILLTVILIKKSTWPRMICLTGVLVFSVMSGVNLVQSEREISAAFQRMEQSRAMEDPVSIPLTTEGKNVIVLMLDRALGYYLPSMLAEKPELNEIFDGFIWYPNTLSHGGHTNYGAPGLFGGYEYVPEEMNRREELTLREKHNEALLLMPTLFSQEGYTVTISDPPYANYQTISDLSIYQDLPNTSVFKTIGRFSQESAEENLQIRFRNFFCYGFSECVPTVLYGAVYNVGSYNLPGKMRQNALLQQRLNRSEAVGLRSEFMKSWSVMQKLPEITEIREGEGNTFLAMVNKMTHEPMLLSEPDYTPVEIVDNTEYDNTHDERFKAGEFSLRTGNDWQMSHYHINMAALLQVGNWLDYLREKGVYDNTRIIIVSDHGTGELWQIMSKMIDGELEEAVWYNPLLLVKDFDSHGEIQADYTFMTNADTPFLAMEGLIEDPVNPFTGNAIESEKAKEKPQKVITAHYASGVREGNRFPSAKWYTVHDDIFDMDNWSYAGEE